MSDLRKILQLSTTKKKVADNILWVLFGKSINIISGLIIGVLVARYLGPKYYGLMNYVVSYVTLFSILATFGLDSIVVRELSGDEEEKEILLGTAFVLRLVFALITECLVIFSTYTFEADKFTRILIVIYSISLILGSFNIIQNYFISIVYNKPIVLVRISKTIIVAFIKILFILLHLPLFWFVLSLTLEFFLVALGYVYVYQKYGGDIRLWKFEWPTALIFVREAFPLVLSGAAVIIYQKIDQIMIRNMIDDAALGQYAVASKFSEMIIFIPTMIIQTVVPILVKIKKANKDQYLRERQRFFDYIFWSSVVLSFIIFISARYIISILYGDAYSEAIPVLRILAWKAVFVGMFVSSGQIIIIEKKQKLAVVRNIIGSIFSVILNVFLIPLLGIRGAAIATILTLLFTGYLSHIFIPVYRYMFFLQTNTVLFAWKRMFLKK